MGLIIIGGIGYPVLIDINRDWKKPWRDRWDTLLLHSKLILVGTTVLLVFGAVMFLLLEWDGVLRGMSIPRRFLVACFHSTTCRTAGFNTIDVGKLTSATLFLSILLMAIGTGPCSTGGGFKVSTLTVLILRVWTSFRGRRQINVGRRTISETAVNRAIAAATGFAVVAIILLTVLLVIEPVKGPYAVAAGDFMDKAFEVVSALGTVGLSTGITPHLSGPGQDRHHPPDVHRPAGPHLGLHRLVSQRTQANDRIRPGRTFDWITDRCRRRNSSSCWVWGASAPRWRSGFPRTVAE